MDYTKNIVDLAIFSILGFMGFIALWFTVERMIFLRRFNAGAYSDANTYAHSDRRYAC